MSPIPLFIAALEYSPGKDLKLWTEEGANAENLLSEYLEPNEISVHSVTETPHGLVARINVANTALSDFVE
jgi:hypothetical protein